MSDDGLPTQGDGRGIALEALKKVASSRPGDERLTDITLERVVNIAWRHQFSPADRGTARSELREALKPEVAKRMGEKA